MSSAPRPACLGFSTSVASRIAPAQVPKVGLRQNELLSFSKPSFAQQLKERAGLPTGDDQAVDFVQLLGLFYEHNFGAQLFKPAAVRVEIALQGQNSDDH